MINDVTVIDRVLCLPSVEVAGLESGRIITILPSVPIQEGWNFAIGACYCPDFGSESYSSHFFLHSKLLQNNSRSDILSLWATCECFKIIHKKEQLESLPLLTVWSAKILFERFEKYQSLLTATLRVYRIIEPCPYHQENIKNEKIGKFIGLSMLNAPSSIITNKSQPILDNLQFEHQNSKFLSLNPFALPPWIKTITSLADRSIEQETGTKSNYQAGTDFENIVKQSLEFLGFQVEEAYKGGAGGLDLYCSKPYPLAGECKSGSTIPDRSVEELARIAKRHLGANYEQADRFIIGSGQPSKQLKESALFSKVSIMNRVIAR
jgi:hypothetical protein